MFRHKTSQAPKDEEGWECVGIITLTLPSMTGLRFAGGINSVLAAWCPTMAVVIDEAKMETYMREGNVIIQFSPDQLEVRQREQNINKLFAAKLRTSLPGMQYFDFDKNTIAVWNKTNIEIWEVNLASKILKSVSKIDKQIGKIIGLCQQHIVCGDGYTVEILDLQGQRKHEMRFIETEGKVKCMSISGELVCIVTYNNIMKIYEYKKPNKPRQFCVNRYFLDKSGNSLGDIDKCCINKDGSAVAIIAAEGKIISDKLWVYLYEVDKFIYFEPKKGFVPKKLCFDVMDPRLLVVEFIFNGSEDEETNEKAYTQTFFVTAEHGIKLYETIT